MAEDLKIVTDEASLNKGVPRPRELGSLKPWQDSRFTDLTPSDLEALLIESASFEGSYYEYLSFAEECEENDPYYAGLIQTRKLVIASTEYVVVAKPGQEAIGEEIQRFLVGTSMKDLISHLSDGLGKGYGVAQNRWSFSQETGKLIPSAFDYVFPHWFRHDYFKGQFVMVDPEDQEKTRDIPPRIFSIHEPKTKSGAAIRGGLARVCAWWILAKRYGLKDWVNYAEMYGIPFRIMGYPDGMEQGLIDESVAAVSRLASTGTAAIPEGISVILNGQAVSGGHKVYEDLIVTANREMSGAIQGQVGTSAGGQGNSKQTEMGRIRADFAEADTESIANTIQKYVIKPYVELNYGFGVEVPEIAPIFHNTEDFLRIAQALPVLIDRGFPVSVEALARMCPLKLPMTGEVMLYPLGSAVDGMGVAGINDAEKNESDKVQK